MKKTIILFGVVVLGISFLFTACNAYDHTNDNDVTITSSESDSSENSNVRAVTITSNGNEYEGFSHGYMFRYHDEDGIEWVAGGMGKIPEDVADELTPFPLGEDFQIVIEGERQGRPRYYFSKLIDGEWTRVLRVRTGNHYDDYEIFFTHDLLRRDGWEQVHSESFLDLLVPGEYILEVAVSWGNSQSGFGGQHFFRLIK